MTSVKKVKVALLALVAALVIAIPTSAFAANVETGSIEITGKAAGHTYQAYQVFEGTMSLDDTEYTLSDVKWSEKNIDAVNALAAAKTALGDNSLETAADVLEALNAADEETNVKFSRELIKQNALKGDPAGFTGGTAPDFKYRTVTIPAGFYLVKEANVPDGEAETTYILLPVGGTTASGATVKTGIPELEKKVREDSTGTFGKAADWDFNRAIDYYLKGTLPTEYSYFAEYYYKFTDNMSAGLTLDPASIKVYAVNDPNGYDEASFGTTTANKKDITSAFTITPLATATKQHYDTFTAEIQNLKSVSTEQFPITKGTVIVVEYQAYLNNNAIIGLNGNPNDAKLTYSTNPNHTGNGTPTGDTPEDTAIVFTYELDNTKVNEDGDTLEGAEFYLYKIDGAGTAGTKLYAKLTAKNEGVWNFSEWVTSKAQATPMETTTNGLFNIVGLDGDKAVSGKAGTETYYLEEETAPIGYDKLTNPIKITIDATVNYLTKYNRTVAQTTANNPAGNNAGAILADLKLDTETPAQNGTASSASGICAQEILNTSGSGLPSTGGIGTTIFYIVGAALILAAAITMVVRRRGSATA